MAKLLVAMSGGVDSSVAVKLLLDEGHTLLGVTFVTDSTEGSVKAAEDAKSVAAKFGISHETVDISREFEHKVKEYFVRTYEEGGTPNPCVICNREIKFGLLLRYAKERGFDGVATGHYAVLTGEGGRTHLRVAADASKDQTYMLALVPEDKLALAHFPLGRYTKREIRTMAEEMGLSVADKKDSQDICFIPDGDYVRFLTEYRGHVPVGGKYVDPEGNVLGDHRGQECYTVGQRRGLGIALGRHMFVLDRNAESNTVVLGDAEGLMRPSVTVSGVNLIGRDSIADGEALRVKIRYAHRAADARIFNIDGGGLRIEFDLPQRAPSRGQLAVIYDGDEAIGGGIIE